MKYSNNFFHSLILFVFAILPSHYANALGCYSGINCNTCDIGRAYVYIGNYCTVCMQFCFPKVVADSGKPNVIDLADANTSLRRRENVNGLPVSNELLVLSASISIIQSVATINPEAAEMLLIMNAVSKTSPSSMPTIGFGTSTKKVSYDSVLYQTLHEAVAAEEMNAQWTEIGGSEGDYAKLSWILSKSGEGTSLIIYHRIFDKNNIEKIKLYPDVAIAMTWIKAKYGGHWEAVSWSELK